MEKDLKTKLINRKIKKPDPIIMSIGMWLLGILNRFYGVEFSYDYDPKSIKNQPTILLSSHASRLEFIYAIYGFKRKDVNVVCGFQNILKKGIYHLLIKLGVISKYLYQPDFVSLRKMMMVLKRNGALGLFPEGIQSTSREKRLYKKSKKISQRMHNIFQMISKLLTSLLFFCIMKP